MDSVGYVKVESKKLRLFGIICSVAENGTRQTRRVIGDLYSPDSFDTSRASSNVQPCANNVFVEIRPLRMPLG